MSAWCYRSRCRVTRLEAALSASRTKLAALQQHAAAAERRAAAEGERAAAADADAGRARQQCAAKVGAVLQRDARRDVILAHSCHGGAVHEAQQACVFASLETRAPIITFMSGIQRKVAKYKRSPRLLKS